MTQEPNLKLKYFGRISPLDVLRGQSSGQKIIILAVQDSKIAVERHWFGYMAALWNDKHVQSIVLISNYLTYSLIILTSSF